MGVTIIRTKSQCKIIYLAYYADDTTLMAESEHELKSLLMSERGE